MPLKGDLRTPQTETDETVRSGGAIKLEEARCLTAYTRGYTHMGTVATVDRVMAVVPALQWFGRLPHPWPTHRCFSSQLRNLRCGQFAWVCVL